MSLTTHGWNPALAAAFEPFAADGLAPARVTAVHRTACHLHLDSGDVPGVCTGRLLHATEAVPEDRPAVGDWTAVRLRTDASAADIHAVLPRRSAFTRRAPGGGGVQVIAANIDTAVIVTGLDANFNVRRIERYLTAARAGGARPVVVLNKADVAADPGACRDVVARAVPGTPVHLVSALQGDGIGPLWAEFDPGTTAVVLGSSGAGKSTLLNRLLGRDVASTGPAREDDARGRHTTTHRELFVLPNGALLADVPGLREIALAEGDAAALRETFADIAELAAGCRFADCGHAGEPGCAIEAALEGGLLDAARWAAYRKLQREQAWLDGRDDASAKRVRLERWKRIARGHRARARLERDAQR